MTLATGLLNLLLQGFLVGFGVVVLVVDVVILEVVASGVVHSSLFRLGLQQTLNIVLVD